MAEDLQALEREYCPPIDSALFHAIYSEHANIPDGIQLARGLLDALKESALEEQLTDFDPSGSSGDALRVNPSQYSPSEVESNAESGLTKSTVTDYTSVSNDLLGSDIRSSSGSSSGESCEGGYFKETEGFDTTTKEFLLMETFPTLRPDLIEFILKKCNYNYAKATDELLNQVYFEDSRGSFGEEPAVAKGVDAFFDDSQVPQQGKGKGKGKGRKKKNRSPLSTIQAASEAYLSAPDSSSNKWADGSRDIDFIVSKTRLPKNAVASMYHANGTSLSATITAILEKNMKENKVANEADAETLSSALELVDEFSGIELDIAVALIRVTAPSTAAARELANAFTTNVGKLDGGIEVVPRYAPIRLSDPTPSTHNKPLALPPPAHIHSAESLFVARGEAFNQASAAYRRGKSDPLMKAAAGYYSQVGRDLNVNLRQINEAQADALVDSQSSVTHLDLHGVTVQSATRIAKQKVQVWWDGLGEARIPGGGRKGVGEGYRIITGLGRHSKDGKGKIGPAVVRALVKEGWKVEVGSGELLVVGKARTK
ncbi:hypothetical protein GQ43DRAFT_457843 [Delitschia confertaspora ATCC 74209]|uniref:Smr domain-containing protein n=1 Tax=Delitschia confertaspora ATCC 74209 TaxID=1513339 RepID=A0A9P4JFF9_9PLEO|nr:hypothetical protein GQ43DRAFT_457843 [Delitschia confertaspora ATCC 74209]